MVKIPRASKNVDTEKTGSLSLAHLFFATFGSKKDLVRDDYLHFLFTSVAQFKPIGEDLSEMLRFKSMKMFVIVTILLKYMSAFESLSWGRDTIIREDDCDSSHYFGDVCRKQTHQPEWQES
jgi:hypothetical protein